MNTAARAAQAGEAIPSAQPAPTTEIDAMRYRAIRGNPQARLGAYEGLRSVISFYQRSPEDLDAACDATPAATQAQAEPVAAVGLASSRVGRVYLAGPMTGIAEWNFPAFNAAAAGMRASGLDVVNPAEHGIVEGAEWADYLRFDIAKIADCESIALLPGWSRSRGALLEVHLANALGMQVIYLDGAERAPSAPVGDGATQQAGEEAHPDTERLDWLQQRGATVELVPGHPDVEPLYFRIGGCHAAVAADIREAIDAARAAQAGDGNHA